MLRIGKSAEAAKWRRENRPPPRDLGYEETARGTIRKNDFNPAWKVVRSYVLSLGELWRGVLTKAL